jgi:hypothetical protein
MNKINAIDTTARNKKLNSHSVRNILRYAGWMGMSCTSSSAGSSWRLTSVLVNAIFKNTTNRKTKGATYAAPFHLYDQ